MVWTSETAPRHGRPPGSPNRTTSDLRDAIIAAAEEGNPDGLVGYYRNLKTMLPEKFSDHVRALLPKDLKIDATIASHAMLAGAAASIPAVAVEAARKAMLEIEAQKKIDTPEDAK